jgi:fluoride ion exporter CrcB/FEX
VAAGGAIGALLRGATGEIVVLSGFDPLWTVLIVNVTGSLFLGLLIVWETGQYRYSPLLIANVRVGFVGAVNTV